MISSKIRFPSVSPLPPSLPLGDDSMQFRLSSRLPFLFSSQGSLFVSLSLFQLLLFEVELAFISQLLQLEVSEFSGVLLVTLQELRRVEPLEL